MASKLQCGDCDRCSRLLRWVLFHRFGVQAQDVLDVAQDACLACVRRRYRARAFRLAWSTVVGGLARSAASAFHQTEYRFHVGESSRAVECKKRYWADVEKSRLYFKMKKRESIARLREKSA